MKHSSRIIVVGITLVLWFFMSTPSGAEAQTLSFEVETKDIINGSEFVVRVMADTDQPINAYEVSFSFPADILTLMRVDNSHSAIDVWQSEPRVSEDGRVEFKGGSTVPFRGANGELSAFWFRARDTGKRELVFRSSALYLANGKGTKVIPTQHTALISVRESAAGEEPTLVPRIPDRDPPEIRFASLLTDPFNEHQILLGFFVSDSGSGIKESFVRSRTWFPWSAWQKARNPTAFPANVWMAELRVVDNEGNVARRAFYNSAAIFTWLFSIGVAVAVCGTLIVMNRLFVRRKGILIREGK